MTVYADMLDVLADLAHPEHATTLVSVRPYGVREHP